MRYPCKHRTLYQANKDEPFSARCRAVWHIHESQDQNQSFNLKSRTLFYQANKDEQRAKLPSFRDLTGGSEVLLSLSLSLALSLYPYLFLPLSLSLSLSPSLSLFFSLSFSLSRSLSLTHTLSIYISFPLFLSLSVSFSLSLALSLGAPSLNQLHLIGFGF